MLLELTLATTLLFQSNAEVADTTAETDAAKAQAEAAEKAEMAKVKCRYVHELNSRIPSRICRTKGEWARIAEEQREANANNRRNGGTAGERGTIYGADGVN